MRRRTVLLALLLLMVGLVVTSRFAPQVERIEVTGGEHYDRGEILKLARLAPNDPFLWVTPWSLQDLVNDPWISHVRVMRHWPDTISLRVWEREPVLFDGETAYALDGTVLPGVGNTDRITRLEGWGTRDLDEILELRRMLAEFEPEVIRYSPSGFEVELADTVLYTPSSYDLQRHWAGFLSRRGSYVAVYPWGVSVRP